MARAGTGHRAGGGRGALIPRARLTQAERAAKAAAKAARRDLLPAPNTKAARRQWQRWVPDTDEARWLQRAQLTEQLAGGSGEYLAELRELATKRYRAAYNAQQKARGKGPAARAAARAKEWVKVKAHRRRRPR